MKQSKSLLVIGSALLLSAGVMLPGRTQAQTPAITNAVPESAAVSIHAKITAIDPAKRAVTLTGASGQAVTVTAGPDVRLEMLKTGQTVDAKYYRSVGFVVNPPAGGGGVPTSDDQMTQVIARNAQAPGGAAISLTKISGTVVGLNLSASSVDVIDASGGGVHTLHVTDPARVAMLGSLKVGDTITAVISQALAVTIEPAKRSWF